MELSLWIHFQLLSYLYSKLCLGQFHQQSAGVSLVFPTLQNNTFDLKSFFLTGQVFKVNKCEKELLNFNINYEPGRFGGMAGSSYFHSSP